MADFLSDNTAWLALVCGLLAVAYGIGLTACLNQTYAQLGERVIGAFAA